MKVLVIPEDFRNDQYILKPLIQRLFRTLEVNKAHVRVCQDPLLQGVNEAMKPERIREVLTRYGPTVDLFLLCVDRDGIVPREQGLGELERGFPDYRFLATAAREELETWVLAGLRLPSDWRWAAVRAEVSVKERYFDPLVRSRGLVKTLGRGRKVLGEEAARRIDAIRRKCPEDFDRLAQRIGEISP